MACRFGLVYSYGLLSQPGLAIAAFDEMQALGVWRPNDKKTANALLNTILSDADKMFERYTRLGAGIISGFCRYRIGVCAPGSS